jgi:hypothetical protein
MQLKTGSYVGTGVPHAVTWSTGPLFTPDLVIVKADDSQRAVFRTSAMPDFQTALFTGSASLFPDAIRVFIPNGFQLGTHATVNTLDVNYYWTAFYDNGAGDFDVGSYIGNGVNGRNLDIVGFEPTVLWIRPRDAKGAILSGVWRVVNLAGDNTLGFGATPPVSNFIEVLQLLGFRLGDSTYVNEDGDEYYYVAFRDVAGLVETGTYAGNGIDDRDINVGFEPDLVFVKSDYFDYGVLRIDTMPVGQSGGFQLVALLPDRIQGFAANVFQVGTNAGVNHTNVDYYWAAWKVGSSYASTTSTSTLSTTSTSTLSTTSTTTVSTTTTSTLSTTLTTTTLPFTPVPGTSPVLRICDSEGCINLLKRKKQSGYRLCGWTPRIADYKRGGIWQDSPIAEGRRLAQRRFGNVTETMNLSMSGHNLETLIRESQDLRRLMEKASNYWWADWQNDPIWLEARAKCETNVRYAILHRGKILVDNSPYEQPFMERLYGRTAARKLSLILERGHWMSLPPERSTSVLASARECYEWVYHLEFNGETSWLGANDAGLNDLHDAAFTAEAWIRADSLGEGNEARIVTKTRWMLRLHPTEGLYAWIDCAVDDGLSSSGTDDFLPDGEWHHVAMTWNDATYNYPRIWVDGVEASYASTQNRNGAIVSDAASSFTISESAHSFDGGIGWVRVSDVVRYVANFTPPERCKLPDIDANTVGQWIGPETSGTIIDNQEGTAARDGVQTNCLFDIDCERCYGNVDLAQALQPVADHVYVANKRNEANITHIFRYDADAAPPGFSGNLVGTAPFDLLPAVPAVDDIVYFGIQNTPPDWGYFSSLVFDLENAQFDITGMVWEFWDGGAWDSITIAKDNTESWFGVPLSKTDINSIVWELDSGFSTTTVNGITGAWVRVKVTSVGIAPTPPRQQNRDVYTVTWPYLEMDANQVGGDIIALARYEMVSAGLEVDDVIVGLRSLSRGADFSAYLNCSGYQNPPGVSVVVSGNCSIVSEGAEPPTRYAVQYNWGADGKFEIRIAPAMASQYYGVYHVYVRGYHPEAGYAGDTLFNVSFEQGSGKVVQQKLTGLYFTPGGVRFELVDLGRLELSPPSLLDSGEEYNENKIVVDVSGTSYVVFYDFILIPIDEWAGRFTDLEQGADSTNRLSPGRLLEFDSVRHPKQQLRANLWARNTDRIVGHWDKRANGPVILQANADQRLWVLASLIDTSLDTTISRPEILTWFSVEAVQRYLSMRGDR